MQIWNSNGTYIMMKNPAASYIAATFHPTIGQRAHQSLSNAATPELGMIPPRIRVNAGLHIAEGHNHPNQHCWVYQGINRSAKPAQSKGQPLHTSSKTTLHSPVKKQRRPVTAPNEK